MTVITALKYFALLIVVIIPLCNSFVDIRHRFELPQIPTDLKNQILTECKPTFVKFFHAHSEDKITPQTTTMKTKTITITPINASAVENGTEAISEVEGISSESDGQQCPIAISNCILTKTSPFMEHCKVNCSTIAGKSTNDFHCWNDNCFIRATRICEEKFWRTVSAKNRKKKKKRMHCMLEIKHCYKLACLKCLGRECSMNCYGGGIQYTHLTKPSWKGYEEYKKFFPEVEDIIHKFVFVPEKINIVEDYDE
ncbi:unnamed protein product [Cercopithifilaria johnstoni]|uniref:Uncharacterized protein n=1 Tax=Cercopithifilaria johnstoni TaxID=2874296 RepID=A0A8J2LYL9_9BILA|nr:unnamed protein product [Cercopithifilaria johnstoni]